MPEPSRSRHFRIVLRRDAEIDVLFTDIVMPRGMNGVELAREARRLRPNVRVLLSSGYPAAVLASDHGAGDDGGGARSTRETRSGRPGLPA